MEAFGGLPGVHKGLVDGLLRQPGQVCDKDNITDNERKSAEEEANESVKGTLLISGAEKRRYGKLKDKLANNYLLGTDQYPNTFDKALHIWAIIKQRNRICPSGGMDPSRVWPSSSKAVEEAEATEDAAEGQEEEKSQLVEEPMQAEVVETSAR